MKIIFLVLITLSACIHASWHEEKLRGWAWYEKEQVVEEIEEAPTKKTATEQLEYVQIGIKEKIAKAILSPSEENVRDYMEEQKKWVDQSGLFARIWTDMLLKAPLLDQTTVTPVSQYGIKVANEKRLQERKEAIFSLKDKYGLFFFFRGDCLYSHAFAPVIEVFKTLYSWEVVPISIDGLPVPGFEDFQENDFVAKQFGVEMVPAVFAVNPITEEVIPLSFGMIALDQLEDRIFNNLR